VAEENGLRINRVKDFKIARTLLENRYKINKIS